MRSYKTPFHRDRRAWLDPFMQYLMLWNTSLGATPSQQERVNNLRTTELIAVDECGQESGELSMPVHSMLRNPPLSCGHLRGGHYNRPCVTT